mmetsp:Transcript_15061/g.29028  ORF Transcript_15061/g.29028 Transcript_15061/m.29028 type:complete len:178 (+) Transcript_15061:276-809(+)
MTTLGGLDQLRSLDLRSCVRVTAAGLRELPACSAITRLDLQACKEAVTQEGVRALVTSLPRLRALNLSLCPSLDDAGVRQLAALRALAELDVAQCQLLTDDSLLAMASFPALAALNLSWCGEVSDEGVRALAGARALRSVTLVGCWDVTDEGVLDLIMRAGTTLQHVGTPWGKIVHP